MNIEQLISKARKNAINLFNLSTDDALQDLLARVKNCRNAHETRRLLIGLGEIFIRNLQQKEYLSSFAVCALLLRGGLFFLPGFLKAEHKMELAFLSPARQREINFVCNPPEMLAGNDVLILDVVTDTGQSFIDAARFLKKNGAQTVAVGALFGSPSSIKILALDDNIDDILILDDDNTNVNGFLLPDVNYDVGDLIMKSVIQIEHID
ncbi:MAG TPA: phosphoribosyltransferase [Caldithrix abyssi]|uniref:Phosphoribosyltransferase n=1 Tax=Caldithrix abyssi TaxID=187145 RepID=A0A7V5PPL0_CALAY|nr:phosphoribosyltransferase [Caldithrix abyssi]